jgi:hypothetical protein
MIEALCQYELLLEFNSYLAVDEKATPESVSNMKKWHPEINFNFWADFIAFPIENITGTALQVLTEIKRKDSAFLEQLLFNQNLVPLLLDSGEVRFAKLLRQIGDDKRQLTLELHKFPASVAWPREIAEAIRQAEHAA